MSSNKGTSSSSGGGSYGGDRYDSSDQRSEATKSVGKVVVNKAVQKEKDKGNMMYGGAASTATNEFLVSIGEATKGSQNPDGSFNYILTSKGYEMKYGQKPGGAAPAMGTGNPAGILTSTKISKEMFESQQKLKTAIAGGMALMGVPFIPSAMAYDARRTSFENYSNNFAKAQSSASFTARVNTGSGANVNDSAMETANTNEQDSASTNYRTDAERKLALSRNAEALKASRKFFNSSKQLITGSMV
tara:strand:+ start:4038 stop:4775 length:738 start_codon:yes stop_codon:yes gene_type:complete